MSYEHGFLSKEDLEHYDPCNDWDTHDSAFSIYVNPGDLEHLEPVGKRDLKRHVEDADDWGSTHEDIPFLGVNEGPRKTCIRCHRAKGFVAFYNASRNKDGLSSWCKSCVKGSIKQKRQNRRSKA